MPPRPAGPLARLTENVVLRAAAYYAVLAATAALLWSRWPALLAHLPTFGVARDGGAALAVFGREAGEALPAAAYTLAPTVAIAMAAAVLLSLPIAWVYRLTRSKRGYKQSVVQTLVVMPVIVAGIVVLVKDSLALAFGLAGIVAAVRFRTALDDSKDAMYVFLATGIGLAAAVDVPVAAVLSVGFNTLILLLWYTNFGRQPAHLDGRVGERRLQDALDHLSRTGTFVARVDEAVFRDMSAEQLQALVERASRRARRNQPDAVPAGAHGGDADEDDEAGRPPRPESRLRVRAYDAAVSREALEPVLGSYLKRWRFAGVQDAGDGTVLVDYLVQLRKRVPPEVLLQGVRAAAGVHAIGAELE